MLRWACVCDAEQPYTLLLLSFIYYIYSCNVLHTHIYIKLLDWLGPDLNVCDFVEIHFNILYHRNIYQTNLLTETRCNFFLVLCEQATTNKNTVYFS